MQPTLIDLEQTKDVVIKDTYQLVSQCDILDSVHACVCICSYEYTVFTFIRKDYLHVVF